MQLIKVSSRKLICKSNSFIFAIAGFVVLCGGFLLLFFQFPSLISCWQDKVCFETSIRFQSLTMLQASAGILVGSLMFIGGIYPLADISTWKVIFDLDRNMLITENYWIISRNLKQKQYSLLEIVDVNIDILKDTGADPDTYRVVIILADGTSIPLELSYSSNMQLHRKTVEKIRMFLSLP